MKIGVLKETTPGETRVALTPSALPPLLRDKHEILVESGAGLLAGASDEAYVAAGARLARPAAIYKDADLVVRVQPPRTHGAKSRHEGLLLRKGSTLMGYIAPFSNPVLLETLCTRDITTFAMEFVPRTTRAQSMDALSSMATVSGYKAVLLATELLPKMFPLLMTAAGTIPPATVLILGAGVAGLQAIATAKRLGARVEAFDPRPAVKEQVKSLGATFIDMEVDAAAETTGGYARESSPDFIRREHEAIAARLPKVDLVISTAQVFGRKAPLLITTAMLKLMKPGSVIVDLAAEQGGNCEVTQAGKTVEKNGVRIVGAVNLPALLPADASLLYSRNIVNLIQTVYPKGAATPAFEDDIVSGTCIIRDGKIVHPSLTSIVTPVRKEKRA